MDSETNNQPSGGTDNAQPSTAEQVPYDPDFDDSPETENTAENQEQETLDDETDEATSQESETPDDDTGADETEESDSEEPAKTALVALPDGTKVSLEELTKGYQRQQDYTRKTQEHATKAKAETENLSALSSRLENTIGVISQFLEQSIPAAPDQALAFTNPQLHYQQKIAHDNAMAQVAALIELGAQPKAVKDAIDQASHGEMLATEIDKLHAVLPHLAKPENKEKFFGKALNVAKAIGFSDAEVRSMTDHRFFRLADLAIEGMAAREARKIAKAKVANVPPMVQAKRTSQSAASPNKDILAKAKRNGGMTMQEAASLVGDFD